MKITLAISAVMVAIYIITTYLIHKKGKPEQPNRYKDKYLEPLMKADQQVVLKRILKAQEITNEQELKAALLRVKVLWNIEPDEECSDELDKLTNYICAYELKTMGYDDV